MRYFRINGRISKFNDANVPIINNVIKYLNTYFRQRMWANEVTYTTNMNTDIAGDAGEIVRCSTDNKFYGCTVSGVAGSATWVALN